MLTASCPGKVLVLGGYCILEHPNSGLVIAADARFKCQASFEDLTELELTGKNIVKISSPQWGNWKGTYEYDQNLGLIPDKSSITRNQYVEKPVAWALYCALKGTQRFPKEKYLKLTLLADNDFYSQQENLTKLELPRTSQGLRSLPVNCEVANKSAKTGLGSSAAMISSIVGAILALVGKDRNVEYAHRVAQLCHAAVQGKIGSGFDVCAAFYGSMKYVRYDPEPLSNCLSLLTNSEVSEFGKGAMALESCAKSDDHWNHIIEEAELPRRMELLCGDVAGGSETPSMSRKILEWRNASDGTVWARLISRNDIARKTLKQLSEISISDEKEYDQAIDKFSKEFCKDWKPSNPIEKLFVECYEAFRNVRTSLREVGNLSGVPVEPIEQQELCDSTMEGVPGVLACGVPGAGGYDAVFALVLGEDSCSKLEHFWENYQKANVCPLLLRKSKNAGIVIEDEEGEKKKVRIDQ